MSEKSSTHFGEEKKYGTSDRAVEKIEEDFFEISQYTEGLKDFILHCETPMTIAIQGDWGSGKTSFLNLIRNALEPKKKDGLDSKGEQDSFPVKTIMFNTWAFSQFNMSDMLPINLMNALITAIPNPGEEIQKLQDSLKRITKAIVHYAASRFGAESSLEVLTQKGENEDGSLFSAVEQLRDDFEKAVSTYLKKENKQKLVIFIDDLDRLSPGRAVELLEILKLFLECERCVFVLAIDYSVVCRGIKEKYGEDMDEEKGRSFFDKIIQVPFKMPVERYKIKTFLEKSSFLPKEDQKNLDRYADLIMNSIGCNPRAIKRMMNAFQLQEIIYNIDSEEKTNSAQDMLLLFAVLCLQFSYEEWYLGMVGGLDSTFNYDQLMDELKKDTDTDALAALKVLGDNLGVNYDADNLDFMRCFAKALPAEKEQGVKSEDIERLKKILKITDAVSIDAKRLKNTTALTEDREGMKKINQTDEKSTLLTLGAGLHIGYGTPITIVYKGDEYPSHMHNKIKGRVDGLSQLYAKHKLKEGDQLKVKYIFAEKKIILEKM